MKGVSIFRLDYWTNTKLFILIDFKYLILFIKISEHKKLQGRIVNLSSVLLSSNYSIKSIFSYLSNSFVSFYIKPSVSYKLYPQF